MKRLHILYNQYFEIGIVNLVQYLHKQRCTAKIQYQDFFLKRKTSYTDIHLLLYLLVLEDFQNTTVTLSYI